MTDYQRNECARIISEAKSKAAAYGTSTDLTSLMKNMTKKIAQVFGSSSIDQETYWGIVGCDIGLRINKLIFGWIPIIGKIADSVGCAGMVEEVGWDAVKYYDNHSVSCSSNNSSREIYSTNTVRMRDNPDDVISILANAVNSKFEI